MDKTSVFYTWWQENATKPVITWVIQHFLCLFWVQPAAVSHYAEGRICFFSPPSSFLIFTRQFSFPQKPSSQDSLATDLKEMKAESVRELGKESGSEDVSVARLKHNEVWTQSDSALNYGK